MKAAVYRQYGPPEVVRIEEVEQPIPGDDDVLVRIVAATVCTLDWRLRKPDPPAVGWFLNGFGRPRKHPILGLEYAGTVAAVGKNVSDLRLGERVFGSSLELGSHAEYACYARSRVVRMPSNATFAEAAAIPYGGLTALSFLRKARVKAGQKVLIYGASGSVGSAAVQIAKHLGAQMTGICSTTNVDLVRSIGADGVIDYTTDGFAAAGRVYDVVQDTIGGLGYRRARRVLKRGGVFVDAGPGLASLLVGPWLRATRRGNVVGTVAKGGRDALEFLADLVAQGRFRPVIERRYPLTDIVAAHRHAEGGHKRGNLVIHVGMVPASVRAAP